MANKKTSVVVLENDADPLVLRSGPTNAQVRAFVKEHHRRFLAGEPGGPGGANPRNITSATRYDSELEFLAGADGKPVKIEDIIRR